MMIIKELLIHFIIFLFIQLLIFHMEENYLIL